jgi:hypothetical protein
MQEKPASGLFRPHHSLGRLWETRRLIKILQDVDNELYNETASAIRRGIFVVRHKDLGNLAGRMAENLSS